MQRCAELQGAGRAVLIGTRSVQMSPYRGSILQVDGGFLCLGERGHLLWLDLSPKGGDFKDTALRLRKLVIGPGGVVPWHDHKTRPANIYVLSGAVTEYRSTCAVPIEHKAGEVTAEFGEDLAHWWKNNGSEPAILLSSDILPPQMKTDGMM